MDELIKKRPEAAWSWLYWGRLLTISCHWEVDDVEFRTTSPLTLFSRFSVACRPATSGTSWSWRATWPSWAWTRRTRPGLTRSLRRSAASWSSFLFSSWASRTCSLPSAPRRPWCPWRSGPETEELTPVHSAYGRSIKPTLVPFWRKTAAHPFLKSWREKQICDCYLKLTSFKVFL